MEEEKTCGKMRKMLDARTFTFYHNVFKAHSCTGASKIAIVWERIQLER